MRSAQHCYVHIEPNHVSISAANSAGRKADFVIATTGAAWEEFAKIVPVPRHHDVVALIESGHAKITGDVLPFFRHLFLVKGVIAAIFRGTAE